VHLDHRSSLIKSFCVDRWILFATSKTNDKGMIALQFKSGDRMPHLVHSLLALKNRRSVTVCCCTSLLYAFLKCKLNSQTIQLFYCTSALESFLWILVSPSGYLTRRWQLLRMDVICMTSSASGVWLWRVWRTRMSTLISGPFWTYRTVQRLWTRD
jgi:IS1 family transposase